MCAALLECLKARSAEQPFELLVGEAGIGDGRFALERRELLLLGVIAGGFHLVLDQLVNQHIHAADEKARHRGDVADVFA